MRISDWSSDVCSSDLKLLFTDDGDGLARQHRQVELHLALSEQRGPLRQFIAGQGLCAQVQAKRDHAGLRHGLGQDHARRDRITREMATIEKLVGLEGVTADDVLAVRSEEHTSELQSLMRISYAVFCL